VTPHSKQPPRFPHAVPALLALLVGALAALTLAGPVAASATSACGDKVLADWFDNGRIDRLYPLHCYEEAIDAIPPDIRDYADAQEVISRALQAAVGGKLAPGGRDPTPGNDKQDDEKSPGGKNPNDPNGPSGSGSSAAPDVDTSGPSSVPVPLVVLGGMSLALLAAGGLGYLSRRRQAADADEDDQTLL
jgi:hypothetical protein